MTEYIWLIGASSGIGAALAKHYYAQGATIALSARSEEGLIACAANLQENVELLPLDVTDYDAITAARVKLLKKWPKLDRVIFLAGIYQPMQCGSLALDYCQQTIAINLMGAINTIEALLPCLQEHRAQFALCASIAGYRGLPNSQPYSATKAALINLAESLLVEHGDKVDVRLINPGFVATRLTAKNSFTMPGIISPEKAAKIIAQGLASFRFRINFPWWLGCIIWLSWPMLAIYKRYFQRNCN